MTALPAGSSAGTSRASTPAHTGRHEPPRPAPKLGYYRAVTGDLDMTAAEFRSTATGTLGGGGDQGGPPEITSLIASDATGAKGVVAILPCRSTPTVTGWTSSSSLRTRSRAPQPLMRP